MKKTQQNKPLTAPVVEQILVEQAPTLGEYAHAVIEEQYRRVVKQEKKVLADKDPENLHHMRVSTRRLRTALQVFDRVVELPKAASAKQIQCLAKTLGKLRDLDVQIATLQDQYYPRLDESEKSLLDEALVALRKQRRKAFAGVEHRLTQTRYQDMKAAYETWLSQPQYTPLAQLPLISLLPDLLLPLLSTLLLHPGWLISANDVSKTDNVVLHDLRKACKHVRYEAEFFTDFYNQAFQSWVGEIRKLQDGLGKLQDSWVLLDMLADKLPAKAEIPELQSVIQQEQNDAMSDWDGVRQHYLDPNFRYYLHQMMLEPISSVSR